MTRGRPSFKPLVTLLRHFLSIAVHTSRPFHKLLEFVLAVGHLCTGRVVDVPRRNRLQYRSCTEYILHCLLICGRSLLMKMAYKHTHSGHCYKLQSAALCGEISFHSRPHHHVSLDISVILRTFRAFQTSRGLVCALMKEAV